MTQVLRTLISDVDLENSQFDDLLFHACIVAYEKDVSKSLDLFICPSLSLESAKEKIEKIRRVKRFNN